MKRLLTLSLVVGAVFAGQSARAQILDLSWRTADCGGGEVTGDGFTLSYTIGQPDAGVLGGVGYQLLGGFWLSDVAVCYANCDFSTIAPILNVNDFVCFQQRYAAADPSANCDQSTLAPVLNVNDFICFQQKFAAGCP